MATASDNPADFIEVMEDDLSCNICYNLLRQPKDLDCPHVFCLQCLQKWVKKGKTVECPECRHITIVPHGGLVNLKTNLRLKSMVEKYSERVEQQKSVPVPVCPNHKGEKQHFFCVTCGVSVCRDCLVLQHPISQHEIEELKVITTVQKEEMKAEMGYVEKEMKKIEDDAKILNEIERQLQAATENAEKDVRKRVQEAISEVENKGKEMISSIHASYQQHIKTLKEKQNHTQDMVTQLHNIHMATENGGDTSAKQHSLLADKVEKILLTINQHEMPSLDLATLQFNPGSGPVSLSWFGDLAANRKCELKFAGEFGAFQFAHGIAVTQTGLVAVVDARVNEVTIYDNANGEYKPQFSLGSSDDSPDGKIAKPFNVAVTSDGRFFVTHSGKIVKVFSPEGKYKKMLTVGDRITTTPDDMIVIGCNVNRVITVHQSSGELIRTHEIEYEYIEDIASNGKQIAFIKDNSVHVIDIVTGEEEWAMNMTHPSGICYEPKSNTLLVASWKTAHFVIEQYCITTGHLIACLANNLRNPFSMVASHDSKIYVADTKSVKVYNVQ